MAKRLTDTDKWNKPWYRKLSLKNKVVWQYMLDKCDHAGFIKIDAEIISKDIDTKISLDEIKKSFLNKIFLIKGDLYWIPKFIQFQQNGSLSEDNRCHKSIIDRLASEKIEWFFEHKTFSWKINNGELNHNSLSPIDGASMGLSSPTSKSISLSKSVSNIKIIIHERLRNAPKDIIDFLENKVKPSIDYQTRWLSSNSPEDVIAELETFKDYLDSKNRKYANYSAAFSNWLKSPLRKKNNQTSKRSHMNITPEMLEKMRGQ